MRILHMIPFLWSGAGEVVSRLAVSQQERATVAVTTSGYSKGESDWDSYRTRLGEARIRHFQVDLFDRNPNVFWRSVSQLCDVFREFVPEIVHCHSGVAAAAAVAVRDSGVKAFRLIGQLHSWGENRPKWMNTMDLHAFSRCDWTVCNSADYRRVLQQSGIPSDRTESVPWGLPLAKIRAVSSAGKESRLDSARLGFVGRLESRKGQLELVEAFNHLRQAGTDASLELIGPVADPDYARRIRRLIRDRGLEGHVRLRGRLAEVYTDVAGWDLFVSLSSDEGQGMAILEAMALGVPVVSTDVPGVRDFLKHRENGLIVDPPTPKRIASIIDWALSHREETRCLATRARNMVETRYTWDATVDRMNRLYVSRV